MCVCVLCGGGGVRVELERVMGVCQEFFLNIFDLFFFFFVNVLIVRRMIPRMPSVPNSA